MRPQAKGSRCATGDLHTSDRAVLSIKALADTEGYRS
jgi:hypothetical protein